MSEKEPIGKKAAPDSSQGNPAGMETGPLSPEGALAAPAETALVQLLIRRGYHISFAESCTGGLCAAKIVNVPDASRVLSASFVTYSAEAKIRLVRVRPETIEAFGVVSEETALEMARGAAAETGAEVGAGISGIAGPSGAEPGKPVGTVCFGFVTPVGTFTATKHFGAIGRQAVRQAAAEYVLETLREMLEQR